VGKFIDSGALTALNRILGLAGAGGSQRSELEDGLVTQTLDVGAIVRRSRTIGGSDGGLFVFAMQNAHAVGDTQASSIDPYAPGALVWNGFPAAVPEGFDVWLLGCGGNKLSGAGALTTASLHIQDDESCLGIGVDQAGAALSGARTLILPFAAFDGTTAIAGQELLTTEAGASWVDFHYRVRRGMLLKFRSTTGGAWTGQLSILAQLVPSALGQDGNAA